MLTSREDGWLSFPSPRWSYLKKRGLLVVAVAFLLTVVVSRMLTFDKHHVRRRFTLRTARRREMKNIFYMHVPKCGSSFATLLVQYACPSFPRNMTVKEPGRILYPPGVRLDRKRFCGDRFRRFDSGHFPLPKLNKSKNSSIEDVFMMQNDVVTFLRNPKERMVSSVLDNFHSCNMSTMAAIYPWLYPNIRNPARVMGHVPNYSNLFHESHRESLVKIIKYFWKCVEGCATRMVLGSWCEHDGVPLTLSKIDSAIARLDSFAFIGLTDRWNESVDLWRRLFGGDYSDRVYSNTNPSKNAPYEIIVQDIIEKEGLVDEADSILYRFAESRMNALLSSSCSSPPC